MMRTNTLQNFINQFTFPVLQTGQRVEQCHIGCPPGWPMELGCAPSKQCTYGTVDSRRGTKDFMEVNPATGQPWMSYPYTDAQGNQALYIPPIAITYGITWDDGTTSWDYKPTASTQPPLGIIPTPQPLPSGCMDKTAENYDPLAGVDDGSCTYPVDNFMLLEEPPVEVIETTKTTKTAGSGESKLLMYLLIGGGLYYAFSQGMFKKILK